MPDDYPTIQGAINASVNGDTVIVRPGIYVENINFLGKEITLKSEKGPDLTIIDGNQTGTVVTFNNFETSKSILTGFTIINGSGTLSKESNYLGGGIYCNMASPVIVNNIIR